MIKKIIHIIPQSARRGGIGVACMLLMRALLNLVGLAVLLPVLMLVLDPEWETSEGAISSFYRWSGLDSPRLFALSLCAGIVLFIILKNGLNHLINRGINHYIFRLYQLLSRRLYTVYHQRGLGFIKRNNSSVLARNVNVVCLSFVSGILMPAAQMLAELLLYLLMFAALMFYAPQAALLCMGIFIPAIWIYYALVRRRTEQMGDEENKAQREKSRLVAETFRGYADIEINGAFPLMLNKFDGLMDRIINIRMRDQNIRLLPQSLTEIGLAIGMAALVALNYGSHTGDSRIFFGVFAVAALRLMPSVRSMLSGWTAIRYCLYSIDVLDEALHEYPIQEEAKDTPESTDVLPFEQEISIRDLSFHYEDDKKMIFEHLSLSIRKGEHLGIRGVSGAGKTTLFHMLLGFYTPTSGEILIDGKPLTAENRRAWQNRIGYVSQNLFLVDASFAANVALGIPAEQIDRQRVAEALEAAQLSEFIASLPEGMDTRVGECGCRLSGGQRQRIGIARALYRKADVLFFDEATSALDNHTEEEVNRAINRLADERPGLTMLVIAHRERSLTHCDRVIVVGDHKEEE